MGSGFFSMKKVPSLIPVGGCEFVCLNNSMAGRKLNQSSLLRDKQELCILSMD